MKKYNKLKAEIIADFYMNRICKFLGVEKSDVLKKSKIREFADIRAMVAYLTLEMFPKTSLGDAAKYLGLKSHATAWHSRNKIENLRGLDSMILRTLKHCENIDFVDELLKSYGFTYQQESTYTAEIYNKIIVLFNANILGEMCDLKVFEKLKVDFPVMPEKKYTIENIDIFDAIIMLKNINSNPLGVLINSLKN